MLRFFGEMTYKIGVRDAVGKVAHLLCEMTVRLEAAGTVENDAFEIPFTQANLGDACGLSTVHVNRTLQELRRRGLFCWRGRAVALLKRAEMENAVEFTTDYLHIDCN